MFHLLTNYGSLGATANTQINALNDDVIPIANSLHTPVEEVEMFARLGLGDLALRFRDVTPSIQQLLNSYSYPINTGVIAGENQLVEEFFDFPIKRRVAEPIVYQVTNSGAGPTDTYMFSWIRKQFVPAPRGQTYTMRGASTTAAVANTWTTLTVTWEPQLQAGLYAVTGAQVYGVQDIAFSLIFTNQYFRPGGLAMTEEGKVSWVKQRKGGLGLWGTFPITAYPIVRILCGTTTAAHTIYLDLVKLS